MKKNILKYIILSCVSMALVIPLFSFNVFGETVSLYGSVGSCVNFRTDNSPTYISFSDGGSSVIGNRYTVTSNTYQGH